MMAYQYIAYVSVAGLPPSEQQIDALLLDAREFNVKHNITGVLLCHKNTFFQFFEGTPENVALVYERIKKSKLHHHILELANTQSKKRYFKTWSMGFCYIPQSEMQALMHAEWVSQIPAVHKYAADSFGLKMLKEFWVRLSMKNVA
jgi:Sensors of blue-light using FAD